MPRTRLSLIQRRDQTSAVEVWEESDGSIVTYQDGKPLVASAIDPVTGGITKIAVVTQSQYDALVAESAIDATTEYNIVSA